VNLDVDVQMVRCYMMEFVSLQFSVHVTMMLVMRYLKDLHMQNPSARNGMFLYYKVMVVVYGV
jgi:hypothetical protein